MKIYSLFAGVAGAIETAKTQRFPRMDWPLAPVYEEESHTIFKFNHQNLQQLFNYPPLSEQQRSQLIASPSELGKIHYLAGYKGAKLFPAMTDNTRSLLAEQHSIPGLFNSPDRGLQKLYKIQRTVQAELNDNDHYMLGFDLPSGRAQVITLPLSPYQQMQLENGELFQFGEFVPFSYVERALKMLQENPNRQFKKQLTPKTLVAEVVLLFERYGLSYHEVWSNAVQEIRLESRKKAMDRWGANASSHFEYLVILHDGLPTVHLITGERSATSCDIIDEHHINLFGLETRQQVIDHYNTKDAEKLNWHVPLE